jgi:hypothetical protein
MRFARFFVDFFALLDCFAAMFTVSFDLNWTQLPNGWSPNIKPLCSRGISRCARIPAIDAGNAFGTAFECLRWFAACLNCHFHASFDFDDPVPLLSLCP